MTQKNDVSQCTSDDDSVMFPTRGVFWLIDDSLLCVPYREDFRQGLARSGNTYNHKLVWEYVKPPKCNKPFDYYPRGRVDFTPKGKPIIYMNRNNTLQRLCINLGCRKNR